MTKPPYWDDAIQALAARDRVLAKLIAEFPGLHATRRGDPFTTLARAIVGQQISVKAAQTIWDRVLKACEAGLRGPLEPARVQRKRIATLRACGLSLNKAEYIRDLAKHFASARLDPREWPALDDEALIEALVDVKGIGRWTAEMFLMFHELRADVLPVADIGLQKAVAVHYFDGRRPTLAELRAVAENWQLPQRRDVVPVALARPDTGGVLRGEAARLPTASATTRSAAARLLQLAVDEVQRAVGLRSEIRVVRHDDQCRADDPIEFEHQVEHRVRVAAIEIARGFVRQHATRRRHECARECDTLALAARKLARQMADAMLEADARQHVVGTGPRRALVHSPNRERHGDVLQRSELRQQVMELVDEPERAIAQGPALCLGQRRQHCAFDTHFAAGRQVEPSQQVQQRAFAGTGCADDRRRMARGKAEIDLMENRQGAGGIANLLGQTLDNDDGFGHE